MTKDTTKYSAAIPGMIEILLVEDSPGDVRLTQEALKAAKILNRLSVVPDGIEGLAFLRKEGKYSNAPKAQLVLLDLNLPKKNGREVLQEIKSDPLLQHIPVVVLTTSKNEQEILESYRLHANCFITKPVDFSQFLDVIKAIEGFWLTVVDLPKTGVKP
jgi:chemotaxis family two-component system response regulator Rcp1